MLVALNMLLRRHFERVTLLNSPQWLADKLEKDPATAIVLDMNFTDPANSGKEGLEMLREIKRKSPDVPVVLLTAYADIELAVKGLKEGASDFVVKPWDNDKLVSIIEGLHSTGPGAGMNNDSDASAAPSTLAAMERKMISEAMVKHGGNLTAVASELGITRQTLYNKIKKMKL